MIKVVIDTNIFISGTLWKGQPHKVLNLWSQGFLRLVVTHEIVAEYEAVFNRLLNHQPELVSEIIKTVKIHAEYVQPITIPKNTCRDPNDEMFLAAALSSKTNYIISGDKDLLILNRVLDLNILSTRQFLETINITK